MPYHPPHLKRAAIEAGATTAAEIDAWVALKKAANAEAAAPRVLEAVPRYVPRHTRSSSNRRRRPALRRAGAGAGAGDKRVTYANRRRHIRFVKNSNHEEVAGVDEIHPQYVDPLHEENIGAAYRLHRSPMPVVNAEAVNQKRRRKTLGNVARHRANIGERAGLESVNAALADLSARASLNAANAMAIAAIGERLYEIMESNS